MPRKPKPKTVHTVKSLLARTIEEGDCLLWTGYHGNKVPTVSHDGKLYPVRRLLSILAGKPHKDGTWYAPRCGCQSCVNPEHISALTTKQHMMKMGKAAKGNPVRAAKVRAYRQSISIIGTQERANEIRMSAENSRALAARFGVSKSTICNIRSGRAWKDISSPWAGLL